MSAESDTSPSDDLPQWGAKDRDEEDHDAPERFEKQVEFRAKDADQQIAYGPILVSSSLDHHGDFFRADAIAAMAEEFEERYANDTSGPGVMHVKFPDESVELADQRITEDAEQLGTGDDAITVPAGTLVQGWQFNDDELWALVEDGILSGYSMAGPIEGYIKYSPGNAPDDIRLPDAVQERLDDSGLELADVPVWQITDATIMEVSAVDMPAVPEALHTSYKSDGEAEKAHPALTESSLHCQAYLEDRGHEPESAKRLCSYLNADDGEKAAPDEPDNTADSAERTAIETDGEGVGWLNRAKSFFTPPLGPISDVGRPIEASASESPPDSPSTDIATLLETMDADELNKTLESITEQQEQTQERVADLIERFDAEADEEAEKDTEDALSIEDVAEGMKALKDNQAALNERLDAISKAQGQSHQLDTETTGGENETQSEEKAWAETFAIPGSDAAGGSQ